MRNWMFELLMYHPEAVAAIRVGLAAVGSVIILSALVTKRIRRKDRALISDRAAVRLFAAALVLFPILCMTAAGSTGCDFVDFQAAGSLVLAMAGIVVAIRAKRKRYILIYVLLFLMVCALAPAT